MGGKERDFLRTWPMERVRQCYASICLPTRPSSADEWPECRKDGQLDFDAMDEFMSAVLTAIHEHGSRAVHVFPPAAQVLIYFADRLANEVVCTVHSSRMSEPTVFK